VKEIKDMTALNRADLHAAIGGLSGDTTLLLERHYTRQGSILREPIVISIKMLVATPFSIPLLCCQGLIVKKIMSLSSQMGSPQRIKTVSLRQK